MPNIEPTTEALAEILRQDLKLGPDVEIPADQPLFGGDLDLDSLDALLLVQSIEKRFGIAIPTERIGQEMFADLQTLAAFVRGQMSEQLSG